MSGGFHVKNTAAYTITKTLCVLYVMVNLIKVKKASIAVAVVLVMLFCVRIDV